MIMGWQRSLSLDISMYIIISVFVFGSSVGWPLMIAILITNITPLNDPKQSRTFQNGILIKY